MSFVERVQDIHANTKISELKSNYTLALSFITTWMIGRAEFRKGNEALSLDCDQVNDGLPT